LLLSIPFSLFFGWIFHLMLLFRWVFSFFALLLLLCYTLMPAQAYDNRFPYFTNDRYEWHTQGYQTVVLPRRLNLNTASFNQLLTLPEVTEPIALAILEQRPFTNLADLNKLSARLTSKQVAQLKVAIGSRVQIAPDRGTNSSSLVKALLGTTVYSKPF
jgi:hypothetical protein